MVPSLRFPHDVVTVESFRLCPPLPRLSGNPACTGQQQGQGTPGREIPDHPFLSRHVRKRRQPRPQPRRFVHDTFGVERETDVAHQINIIDDLTALGYGAIILAPTDSVNLVPICKKSYDHGIPFIIVTPLRRTSHDRCRNHPAAYRCGNRAEGRTVGAYFKPMPGNTGKVLVIGDDPGVAMAKNTNAGSLTR